MTQSRYTSSWMKDTAGKVAISYLLVAGAWIFLSDWLLSRWLDISVELSRWQTVKGGLFVVATSALLFAYLRYCLRRQQQAYQELTTLFDAFPGAIYVSDFHTDLLLYVNRFAEERFGSDWRGKACYSYFQDDQQHRCAFCTNSQLLKDGKPGNPVCWEFRNTRDKRWYQCHDKAIYWADGRLARMEMAIDITGQKELERTKDELLAAVNHEMRTPLTAIAGFAELLGDDRRLPENTRQHLQTIFAEAEKLRQLIETFMEVRRLKSDRARIDYLPIKALDLLQAAADQHPDRTDRHHIEIVSPSELTVYGNFRELVQAFRQLVANACRFSPQGGEIRLDAGTAGEAAELSITDHGATIPVEERERIFEPFHRLDTGDRRRSRGVGLGLTLARETILLHGGSIRVEDVPGAGNRFIVTLPLAPHQLSDPAPAADD